MQGVCFEDEERVADFICSTFGRGKLDVDFVIMDNCLATHLGGECNFHCGDTYMILTSLTRGFSSIHDVSGKAYYDVIRTAETFCEFVENHVLDCIFEGGK